MAYVAQFLLQFTSQLSLVIISIILAHLINHR